MRAADPTRHASNRIQHAARRAPHATAGHDKHTKRLQYSVQHATINPLRGNPTRSPSDARVAATAVLMRVRKAPFRRSPSEARALPLRLPAMQFCEPRSSPATCNMPHATVSMQLATCRTCHAAGNRVGNTERAVACKPTKRDLYPTRSVQQQRDCSQRWFILRIAPLRSTARYYCPVPWAASCQLQWIVSRFPCVEQNSASGPLCAVWGDQGRSCRGCIKVVLKRRITSCRRAGGVAGRTRTPGFLICATLENSASAHKPPALGARISSCK